jgi:tRNA (cytidine/uridine-2'-O-)-methyltransferase
VIRLCANTGAALHLVRPLGFDLDDKKLRRAGLDYHEFARIAVHDDLAAFLAAAKPRRVFAVSTRGGTRYDRIVYADDDALLFGPETRGLPQAILDELPPEQRLRLPMRPGNRSLNLSNAVAVIVFEAWRQSGFAGGDIA